MYYEDTDAGGVVYHGRYPGFFERGKPEYFRERGLSVQKLHAEGSAFPAVRMELDFLAPARLDDLVRVETALVSAGITSFLMEQKLVMAADGKLLTRAEVTLVCVNDRMKPKRHPRELRELDVDE